MGLCDTWSWVAAPCLGGARGFRVRPPALHLDARASYPRAAPQQRRQAAVSSPGGQSNTPVAPCTRAPCAAAARRPAPRAASPTASWAGAPAGGAARGARAATGRRRGVHGAPPPATPALGHVDPADSPLEGLGGRGSGAGGACAANQPRGAGDAHRLRRQRRAHQAAGDHICRLDRPGSQGGARHSRGASCRGPPGNPGRRLASEQCHGDQWVVRNCRGLGEAQIVEERAPRSHGGTRRVTSSPVGPWL